MPMSKQSGYIDKNKLISSLDKDDIIKIITELGSGYKEDSKGNICCSTALCHNGDSPYKLTCYINEDSILFKCYTCGSSFDLVGLVMRAFRNQGFQMTYYKALRWIANTTGKIDVYGDIEVQKQAVDFSWINRLKRALNKPVDTEANEPINENVLDIFANYPWKPWTKEYISYEAMDRFETGYYGLNDSITIPHRYINGELIGIRQRYLDAEDIENIGKYTPIQINGKWLSHSLGNELYGLWVNKNRIIDTHRIILVEAEKSVLQSYSYYSDRSEVVATCGSSITTNQMRIIINDLKCETVIYAPDRDYHGSESFEAEAWYNKQVNKLKDIVRYCKVYLVADTQKRLDYKQSPTDKGQQIFEELLNEKIEITAEEVARVLEEERKNKWQR